MRSARHLILIDIYMKFREDTLNNFQVIEQTWFCDRQSSKENNSKCIKQASWFLHSAPHLMLTDIYMKFREDSLNGFQVRVDTFCDGQNSKGYNSKSIKSRVMVLALCMSSNIDWYLYEVSWRKLEQFSSFRVETILWRTKFKGNNLKSIHARVMVLILCTSSNVDWYFMKIAWTVFKSSSRYDFVMDKVPREITQKV